MQIEYLNPANLSAATNNSRTHSTEQVEQIAASIKEFGFTNPVLIDESHSIIAGHGRCLAAVQLGKTEVPCIVLADLTAVQKRAYLIADNSLALNAGWDEDTLKFELEALQELEFDIDVFGFDFDELNKIIKGADFGPGTEDEQGKLDELASLGQCPHCGKEFDLRTI